MSCKPVNYKTMFSFKFICLNTLKFKFTNVNAK